MEFGIESCAMLIMKIGKRRTTKEIKLPNQEIFRTRGKNEGYIYSEILKADNIKQVEMKEKIRNEYLLRTRKLFETKLNGRNLIKGMNTWAVTILKYSGSFLKSTSEELQQKKKTDDDIRGLTSKK